MGTMKVSEIPQGFLKMIFEQAEKEYPQECCGMILGAGQKKQDFSRLRPCANVYDRYHELDPDNFPRTSKTAYFMEPRELLAIQKEMREKDEVIRVIYHSHIDAGAYFSEEDRRIALSAGGPAYPGVSYLVVSVRERKAQEISIFAWDEKKKNFQKKEPLPAET
jgi:proteasome lid subunit RPN8/RPN11